MQINAKYICGGGKKCKFAAPPAAVGVRQMTAAASHVAAGVPQVFATSLQRGAGSPEKKKGLHR